MKQQKLFICASLNLLNISTSKFIDSIIHGRISYLVNAEKYVIVHMYSIHSLSIHLLMETLVSTFLLLCTMNAAVNRTQESPQGTVFIPFGKVPTKDYRVVEQLPPSLPFYLSFFLISLYFKDFIYIENLKRVKYL